MNKTEKDQAGEIPITDKIEAAKAVMAREKTQAELAAEHGVSRQAVHQWVNLYRIGELHEGRSGRGRPKVRNLTAAEGKKVKAILVRKSPAEAGIGAKFKRWDYEATRRLIFRETGVKMTYRIIADHMERWGLPHGPNIPVIDETGAILKATPEASVPSPEQPPVAEKPKPDRSELLPEFPRRRRGRPRKIREPAQSPATGVDVDGEEEVGEDYIDYQAEVEKSRQFLQNLQSAKGLGKHAKQKRSPFQKKKKKKRKK